MINEYSTRRKSPDEQLRGHDDRNHHLEKNTYSTSFIDPNNSKDSDDQSSSTSNLSNEISSNHTDKNGNKEEFPVPTDQSVNSHMTMKKRVTPVPSSYARRRPYLKMDSSDLKLLPSNTKTTTTASVKKASKSKPIFIAPKKTSPQPHSFSSLAFDDSSQNKSKNSLERQTSIGDSDQSSTMTTWSPAPPSTRFYMQSSSSSLEDNSSDESDHESLLIRERNPRINQTQFPMQIQSTLTIFITDPDGNSSMFDLNNDIRDKSDQDEQSTDEDLDSSDGNTLSPNSTFDISSPPDPTLIPGTQPAVLEKHTLDSIGEEEEEADEEADDEEQETADKEDDQEDSTVSKKDVDTIQVEILGRRWSDGIDKQEQQPSNLSSPASLTKLANVESVAKPNENSPVKLSKTKYLMMKLHLTSSSKDDEVVLSSSRKRTVRRAFDKKRYQTR